MIVHCQFKGLHFKVKYVFLLNVSYNYDFLNEFIISQFHSKAVFQVGHAVHVEYQVEVKRVLTPGELEATGLTPSHPPGLQAQHGTAV